MSAPTPPRIDLNNLCYIDIAPSAYDPDYGEILEITLTIRQLDKEPATYTSKCRSFAAIAEPLREAYQASGFLDEYNAGLRLESDAYDEGHPPPFIVEERILQWLGEQKFVPGTICLAGDEAQFAQRMLDTRMPLVAQFFPREIFDTRSFAAGAAYVRPDAVRASTLPTRTAERCAWYAAQTEVLVARLRLPMPKGDYGKPSGGRRAARDN